SGYASDADVMFVHDPLPAADAGSGSAGPGAASEAHVAGQRGADRAAGERGAAGDRAAAGKRGTATAVGATREPGAAGDGGRGDDDSAPGERVGSGEPGAGPERGADEAATRAAHAVAEELRRL